MKTVLQYLNENDACSEAYEWVKNTPVDWSLVDLFNQCPDGDWLLWLAWKLKYSNEDIDRAIRQALLHEVRKGLLYSVPDDVKWGELLDRLKIGSRYHRIADAAYRGEWWLALFLSRAEVYTVEVRAALPDLAQRLEAELCSTK